MLPIIDSHCHIYPDKIALRAAQGISDFYDIPVILDGTVDSLLKEGKRAGVTHYLVHSVSTHPLQVRSINEFIAEQVRASDGTMTGFGTLHPDSSNLQYDLDHLIDLGLKGVKIHPDIQGFAVDSPIIIDMCKKLAGKVPLLIHAGDPRYEFSNPPQILNFLRQIPGLTVIAAHFGGWDCWEEAASLLCGQPDLYVDCSSSLYALTPEKARKIIRLYGADRVLFGSDYPMWSPKDEMDRFRALGLTFEEERLILYENAAGVIGIRG
ncbi:MAG: amidohydrolase family protein [Saccharofermentanales bacterium]